MRLHGQAPVRKVPGAGPVPQLGVTRQFTEEDR